MHMHMYMDMYMDMYVHPVYRLAKWYMQMLNYHQKYFLLTSFLVLYHRISKTQQPISHTSSQISANLVKHLVHHMTSLWDLIISSTVQK